jgi:hypothetical protein
MRQPEYSAVDATPALREQRRARSTEQLRRLARVLLRHARREREPVSHCKVGVAAGLVRADRRAGLRERVVEERVVERRRVCVSVVHAWARVRVRVAARMGVVQKAGEWGILRCATLRCAGAPTAGRRRGRAESRGGER